MVSIYGWTKHDLRLFPPDDFPGDDGGGRFAFEGPAVEGVVLRLARGGCAIKHPFSVGIKDRDVGIGPGRERAFREPQQFRRCDGVFLDDRREAEALGVVELHQREREFA